MAVSPRSSICNKICRMSAVLRLPESAITRIGLDSISRGRRSQVLLRNIFCVKLCCCKKPIPSERLRRLNTGAVTSSGPLSLRPCLRILFRAASFGIATTILTSHLWRARRQAQPIARCALAQGKTQLAGLPLRILCGVPWAAKRTGPPVPALPVLIPFLRTVYSVVQFRDPVTNPGDICGLPAPYNAPFAQGVNTMGFRSLRTADLFGLVAIALVPSGKDPLPAAQLAPPASPSVALKASPASAQAGQQVTLTWSSTNATSITLEPSVGPVVAQGSTTVRPSQSTTYTVTATGPGGSAHATTQVITTPAPPPPPVQNPSPHN